MSFAVGCRETKVVLMGNLASSGQEVTGSKSRRVGGTIRRGGTCAHALRGGRGLRPPDPQPGLEPRFSRIHVPCLCLLFFPSTALCTEKGVEGRVVASADWASGIGGGVALGLIREDKRKMSADSFGLVYAQAAQFSLLSLYHSISPSFARFSVRIKRCRGSQVTARKSFGMPYVSASTRSPSFSFFSFLLSHAFFLMRSRSEGNRISFRKYSAALRQLSNVLNIFVTTLACDILLSVVDDCFESLVYLQS